MEQCGLRLVVRARALKSRVAAHSHIVVIRETFITRSAFDTLFFFFFVFRDENDRFIEIIRLKNRASRSTVTRFAKQKRGGSCEGMKGGKVFNVRSSVGWFSDRWSKFRGSVADADFAESRVWLLNYWHVYIVLELIFFYL